MTFLRNILGGGQQQQDYQGVVNRYDQGHPSEGYSDQEVMNRYQQIAPNLSPQQYQQGSVRCQTAQGRQAALSGGRPAAWSVRPPGAARTPRPSAPETGGVGRPGRPPR